MIGLPVTLPLEAKAIGALAIGAALLVGYAYWHHQVSEAGAARAEAKCTQADLARATSQAAERARQDAAAKDQDHEDQIHLQAAADQRAALDAAGDRLQHSATAFAARCTAAASAASIGPAATAASGVPADVQGRIASALRAVGDVAGFADASAAAAESCARRYDSLMP